MVKILHHNLKEQLKIPEPAEANWITSRGVARLLAVRAEATIYYQLQTYTASIVQCAENTRRELRGFGLGFATVVDQAHAGLKSSALCVLDPGMLPAMNHSIMSSLMKRDIRSKQGLVMMRTPTQMEQPRRVHHEVDVKAEPIDSDSTFTDEEQVRACCPIEAEQREALLTLEPSLIFD